VVVVVPSVVVWLTVDRSVVAVGVVAWSAGGVVGCVVTAPCAFGSVVVVVGF
jgi:hypothetical protein